MSEINCNNCAISDFKESLCKRCDKMKRIGSADEIEKLIIGCLPSEQPEWKWIPCSERLPEIGQSVLLSVGGMYSAEGCLREDGDWAQFRWDAIQRKDMVGAWKPLPEPYKGEQE